MKPIIAMYTYLCTATYVLLHYTRFIQESLANAKVSARQQCVYEGSIHSAEIYGKSTQGTQC